VLWNFEDLAEEIKLAAILMSRYAVLLPWRSCGYRPRRIDHLGLLDHRIKALEIMRLLPSGLPHGFNLYYDVLRFVD
jgi:hypothetical protein